MSRTQRLVFATGLTLGLLAWELLLVTLLSEGPATPGVELGAAMAWDAMIFWVLGAVASGAARPGPGRGIPSRAARVSLLFLALLWPAAGARAFLQERWKADRTPEASPGASLSALQEEVPGGGRFLCSIADAGARRTPEAESPGGVMWTGMRDAMPLLAVVFPLSLGFLALRAWIRARGVLGRTSRWAASAGLMMILATWDGDGRVVGTKEVPVSEEVRRSAGCAPGAPVRTYELAAIAVDIPLNAHGDHIPQGRMYVLEQDVPAVRSQEHRPAQARVSPGLGQDPIQPLVLRANAGECLVLSFTNRLAQEAAALTIEGLSVTPLEEEALEGFIPRMALPAGQRRTYVVPLPGTAEAEGAYLLHDAEDARREAYGLFGALVVEPRGSTFRHPETGAPFLGTGWHALIDVPQAGGPDFREVVLLSHAMGPPEVAEVRLEGGALLPTLNEMAGVFRPGAFGFNYRSEPFFERARDPSKDPELPGPRGAKGLATPMPRSYEGEPVTLRLLHAGSAEFHAYSLRGAHQGTAPGAPAELAQLLRPGRGLTLRQGHEGLRLPGQAGDFVFHCGMPNHSIGGMQGVWRVLADPEPGLAPVAERYER
jgi:hypothetical protein